VRDRLGAGVPLVAVRLRDPGPPGAAHQELRQAGRRLLDGLSVAGAASEARETRRG
jgi:hypothetical protein